MRDLIANRGRANLGTKLRLLRLSLRENGVVWTGMTAVYVLASAVAEKAFRGADARRRKHRLPGLNSPAMNRQIWDNWDWSGKGEEWTPSPEWKASLLANVLRCHVPEGAAILEIGPGGGRWTSELQARAGKLIGIDISEAAVKACRERFAGAPNAEFRVGSGQDLAGIADGSIDAIWSFDVFVHINRDQFRAYAGEMARVLKAGGIGVIHHGTLGGAEGGWRSDVTAGDAWDAFNGAGLTIVDQFSSWLDGSRQFKVGLYDDTVTVFRRG